MRRRAAFLAMGLMAAGLVLAGCGQAQQAQAPPVFYPPPPDPPRLQFLMNITSADAFQQRHTSFADFIVGGKGEGENEGDIKSPYGLAARDGKIYVCDLGRFRIHVIDVVHRRYATLGTSDQVAKPATITIDADGTKYVCDAGKQQVLVFDVQDRFVRALGDPKQCGPIALAVRGDELFVADALGGEIEVWGKDGQRRRVISSKGNGPAQLRRPAGVAIGAQGHVFVTDMELAVVKEFDAEGRFIKAIGGPGDRPGYFARPKGIAVDPAGRIYVADSQWDKVQVFTPEGQLLLFFGESTGKPHGLVTPTGLAIDTTSLEAFRPYVSESFEPEYLLLVTNQFGVNKIAVHAFGHAKAGPGGAASPEPTAARKP